MTPYITRIAPSPTGDFHIGTARTAYANWLAARASGGKFILRIDDTDDARHSEDAVNVIYGAMQWLNLDYDVSFRQSQRLNVYDHRANWLVQYNKARVIDGGAIALTFDPAMPRVWRDDIAGDVAITDTDIQHSLQNLILLRSDGKPTYHFATVVDDIDFNVNWVIRGHDHLSNTCKHVAIYHALGVPIPKYSHVGLIHKDKKKISKRDGAASMLHYRDTGYHPDAILNFLLRMGWGPVVDDKSTALLPRDRALELFLTGGKMRNQAANFDQAKLDSFDRKYKAASQKIPRIQIA
jgi:glutamyl/glutaminyl-tRNA synthetase